MSGALGGSDLNPIQRKIQSDLAGQGWSWIWVFDSDAEQPPFAYSVGFGCSFNHPEVIVVGLPEETSGRVLSSVSAVLAEGRAYGGGDESGEILEGLSVRFRVVPADLLLANLVQASVFYGEGSFNALQVIWPDREGNFPDEESAPAWLSERQTLSI
ncbi:DUF4262 domain-containing protein [Streptomyces uncialis]|uniref:DUF4262 domain-containing protein n=1 Tax=Streptomyces uncialis TaxID=1048205 RepID=UPI00338DE739